MSTKNILWDVFKLKVVQFYDENKKPVPLAQVANHVGFQRETAKSFYKTCATIREHPDNIKRLCQAENPELEAELLEVLRLERTLRLPVIAKVWTTKAEMFR